MSSFLILLALSTFFPQAQVREKAKDWKLLKTDHFEIYYPDDKLESRAKEFAGWFEEARGQVKEATGGEVKRTIHVFLYRSIHDLLQASFLGQFGSSNPAQALLGKRSVIPDRPRENPQFCRTTKRRALALAEPLHDRILIHCQGSDRYNLWFIRHELAHHAQFEAMYPWRIPSWLIALKNPLVPSWWWEGGADHAANMFDSRKDEYMRDLADERLFTLDELFSFGPLNGHDFRAPYEQGSYFLRFLNEKYGKETVRRLFKIYSENFPYPVSRIVGRTVGKSSRIVEREFADYLRTHYDERLAGRKDAESFAIRLTDSREHYRRRTWGGRYSPDGTKIAYISNVDVRPELYIADRKTLSDADGVFGVRRGIDVQELHSAPAWSPDSRRLVVAGSWENHDYIFLIDLGGSTQSIRLEFDEVYDPQFSPDARTIVFSALKDGYTDLYLYNEGELKRLTEDRHGDRSPAWSPDGNFIVYISEEKGHPKLAILDMRSGKRRILAKSHAVVSDPAWTPDSRAVVVSADVDGIYDLFRVDLAGNASRLTKVRIGAHSPHVSPDGKRVLFTYTKGRGTDLYETPLQEDPAPEFLQEEREQEYDQFTEPQPQGEKSEKSRQFDLEWLMFPVSAASFVTPSLEARFGDLDGENAVHVLGTFAGDDTWGSAVAYTNTRWRPTLLGLGYAGRLGDIQEVGALGGAAYPIFPTLSVLGGWSIRERHEIEDAPFTSVTDSGPAVGGAFSNLSSYQRRDVAWGMSFGGLFTWYDKEFEGDRDLQESFAFFEAAFDIEQDYIIWGRVNYFGLDGNAFLDDEKLELETALRGADPDFEGTDMGVASLEFRFPIYRDIMFFPFRFARVPEFLLIKDVRGFVFAQAGYANNHFKDFQEGRGGAANAGVGLRLDTFVWLWPILNVRLPLRLEIWWAGVAMDEEPFQGEFGIGFSL